MREGRVVVIGGGLAGLACAVALADHGLQVTVLEAAPRLGGRASSWHEAATGDLVDTGPHIFLSEYHNLLAFLARLGTSRLLGWQRLNLMSSLLHAPGLGLPDYWSMRRVALRGMQFGEEEVDTLDAISMLDFLREQGVSEAMIAVWWRHAALIAANVPLERCSAASLLRIHAHLSGYRGLQFGFAAVGLGELYTAQASRIIEEGGGQVRTGALATAILGRERAEGVVLAGGERILADAVVSAVPPQALDPLVPPWWRAVAPFTAGLAGLDRFESCPTISTYLWFDRDLRSERFYSHLWSPTRLNYDFHDLCQIRQGWRGRPTVMASNIIHSHRAHAMRDDEIVRATVAEIAEFAPEAARARVLHADVHRIPMAVPCPVPGFERMRPPSTGAVPGLFLAGDWIRTHLPCTMEGAVKSGWMAAEAVLSAHGDIARLAIPARPYDGLAGLVRRRAARRRGVGPAPE